MIVSGKATLTLYNESKSFPHLAECCHFSIRQGLFHFERCWTILSCYGLGPLMQDPKLISVVYLRAITKILGNDRTQSQL